MSDALRITIYRLVFLCAGCGALLSVDNDWEMDTDCSNCGARYSYGGEANLTRIVAGRPPSQWVVNGYKPTPERG